MHYEHQGMRLWVESDEHLAGGAIEPGSNVNLTVGVEPADASNKVQVKYRVNGGTTASVAAEPVRHVGNAQYFKAQLPCATLCDGDMVEYSAVCQCAGRQVPSAVAAEDFASSFRIMSAGGAKDSNASASAPAYVKRMNLTSTASSQPNAPRQTGDRNTSQLKPTHLSLFVLTRNSGHPVARMPFYAEVGVTQLIPPPKPECKLKEAIVIGLRELYSSNWHHYIVAVETSNPAETLVESLCDALSRVLAQETIDRMAADPAYAAPIISAILQKAKDLAAGKNIDPNDPEALRKLLEDAISAYAKEQDLPLAESQSQQQQIVWAHPLGVLATDHVGYLSFDLTRLPPDVADALALALAARRQDPDTPTETSIWLYPMAREADKIDALSQGRFAHDAIVVKLELDVELDPVLCQPKLCESIKNLGIMAMQNPNLTDWRLSPGSFATNPGTLVGADGCETILPANVALQEFYFYQVIRLTDADINNDIKLGVVHEYRLAWYPLGHSLGQILYSLPLAPGESVNLAVIDWTRRDDAQRKEHTTLDEQLVHNEHRDRTISETVNAAVNEYQHGSSFMGGVAGSIGGAIGGSGMGAAAGISGGIGGATSNSSGSRKIAADTVQKLSDNVTQASSAMRELQSTVVVHSTQSENEAIETRTVVNYNHSHTLTILYYEVLRHFRVVTELVRRRPAVLVKLKTDWFDGVDAAQNILEHRAVIEAALLDTKFGEGFNAIERLSHLISPYDSPKPDPRITPLTDFTKKLPNPPDPWPDTISTVAVGPDLRFFIFELTPGGWTIDPKTSVDDENITIAEAVLWPKNIRLQGGYYSNQLSQNGAFAYGGQPNTFVGVLPPGVESVRWGEIDLIAILVHLHKRDASFQHIKVTAIDVNGNKLDPLLVDQSYESGHLTILRDDWTIMLPTRRPTPAPPSPPFYDEASVADHTKAFELLAHLQKHKRFYSRAILQNQNPVERAGDLEDLHALEHLDNRPLEIVGDYVAYLSTDPIWNERIKPDLEPQPGDADLLNERLVTLPTRGVFAEAKLGHCNASEEIDNTRFWDWQQSPIPHLAPEIAPTQPVTPQPMQPTGLQPSPFPQSLVNIVNPPSAPDPTGLSAALNVLGTANIFRDMSGRAEVADLLKKLSDNSVAIAGVAQKAATGGAGGGYGGGTSSGSRAGATSGASGIGGQRATATQPSATNRDLQDFQGVLGSAQSQGLISPEAAQRAYQAAVNNTVGTGSGAEGLDLQQVGDHYMPPATNPLHPSSNELPAMIGEAQIAEMLESDGLIVFRDYTKNVSAKGIDLIAFDPKSKTVWLVDNKAQFKAKYISDANALSDPIKFDTYKKETIKFLKEVHPHPLAPDAARLIEEGKYVKVVANGWAGTDTRFTKGLFAQKGLSVYDIRMRKLFTETEQALWEKAFNDVVKTRVVKRLPGTRGCATVGSMLFTIALVGGTTLFALRAGAGVKQVLGELAAETALGAVLSRLPSGFIASLVIGMESDNPQALKAQRRQDAIDQIVMSLPDYKTMSESERNMAGEEIGKILDAPLEIVVPEPPAEPLPDWPPSPSSQGSAGGV